MLDDPSAYGTKVMAIGADAVEWAAHAVAGHQHAKRLKVRSGEHLAAILLTAYTQVLPVGVDTDGSVDLIFEVPADRDFSPLLPAGTRVAVEVKSVTGPFREYASSIDRHGKRDDDSGVVTTFRSASGVLTGAIPLLKRAARTLRAETKAQRRSVFLLVHPLDQPTVEVYEHLIVAGSLPPPPDIEGVDDLWVLWVPDQLTAWSGQDKCWHQMLYSAFDPESPPDLDPHLTFLQQVELTFLSEIDYKGGTPYVFGISQGRSTIPPK